MDIGNGIGYDQGGVAVGEGFLQKKTVDPALAGALQSGVEWERVTQGMQRSAEAWANGDSVRVAEDKRLATPDEMRRQVEGNFLSELADEFGGLIELKGCRRHPSWSETPAWSPSTRTLSPSSTPP
ncbi:MULTISPECIES: hypothetical protein [unclassified Dietzia]|uniref:hypothetical protein n=1 Tax=unclassified Dietzia TaxID=2617939 RepID=UPI000D228116|nr:MULTISPECIES: hypothetical protein [unclassified Dietzia]AVZ38971.1 hypothetical protein CT688_05240 [Dietzia sp. JS16-p6b]QGW24124.1 hypothetical protein GJR88_01690 [Dietzia sp. DQ12-45-1b]